MRNRAATFFPLLVVLTAMLPLCAVHGTERLSRLATGSCNRQDLPQPIWDAILEFKPELWVWLGDNIYGDTDDMAVLASKWAEQKKNPGYQRLLDFCPVEGIWDDHDYGRNDAGIEYAWKEESQKLFLDFLDVPTESPRRKRSGIYTSRIFGPEGQQVCVILLDVRTHRDKPHTGGDILGEAQWAWLASTLASSSAQIHIIASGSQILPTEHRFEKWNDYPGARARLFELIARSKGTGIVLLSGDRHFGEISSLENPSGGPRLHEMTTSGLTHSYRNFKGEPNSNRVGEPFTKCNFGTLLIDWETHTIEIALRDAEGHMQQSTQIRF